MTTPPEGIMASRQELAELPGTRLEPLECDRAELDLRELYADA